MPTTASSTYSNLRLDPLRGPQDAREVAINIAPSLTLAAGTILGELTATPGTYKAYASANSDGSQVPKLILVYPVTTDASGNITFGTGTGGGEFGQTYRSCPAYENGVFKTTDLVGLDANAMTVMGGVLTDGTLASGTVRFG